MDAEEFHKSRRRGKGRGEGGEKEAMDDGREEESESQQLRRRSYPPGEELAGVDPTAGEARAGGGSGGDEKGGREKLALDKPGERRDGEGNRDGEGGSCCRRRHKGTGLPNESALGGGEGACAVCGRCNCCGRPLVKDAFDGRSGVAAGAKDVNTEGGRTDEEKEEEEKRRRGKNRGGRGALGGTGHGTSDERHHRHSPHLRRDHDLGARRRDRGEGFDHEVVATGNRSDPSAGRGDGGFARRRRRRPPPQRQDDRREDDHHRHRPPPRRGDGRNDDHRRNGRDENLDGDRPLQGHDHERSSRHNRSHRDESFDGHRRSEVGKGGRRQRVAPGYSSIDLSSEEEGMSPRRRQARREAAAAAAVANSGKKDAPRVSLGKKGDLARHRRRERHSSGEGNAAFSTPLSTPRRGQPAAATPSKNLSAWRGGRQGRVEDDLGRGGGGDSLALGYPTLPPSALPEARRRHRGDVGRSPGDFGDRRGAGRRSREVWW